MSSSIAIANSSSSSAPAHNSLPAGDSVIPSHRSDRASGKGRRRRAASEQRHSEQQHWHRIALQDVEEELLSAARPPLSRRQSRRMARRSARHELEDHVALDGLGDDDDLDVALAISLSLSESIPSSTEGIHDASVARSPIFGGFDMSYESLVLLENVKCVAPPDTVSLMTHHIIDKITSSSLLESADELCTICQHEYTDGDSLILLPCMHNFHSVCGSEWLLNHSKLCPICKIDVTETA